MRRPRGHAIQALTNRTIVSAVRNDWSYRRKLANQPDRVMLNGVQLLLGRWASPELRESVYSGWFERDERRVLEATLRRNDRYMELGAGLGLIATVACGIVGDERVVAYEAIPQMADVARTTAALNGFRPTVINAAVLADARERVTFYAHENFSTSSLQQEHGGSPIVVAARKFAQELTKHRSTYVMMDVEGSELELLADTLPDHVRAICVEVHTDLLDDAALRTLMNELLAQGFGLDLDVSGAGIAFFAR